MAPCHLRLCGLDTLQVKITSEGTDWWGQHTEQDVLTAYTHHDRLGSIVNLTDKYGRNLARADYQEYGEIAFYESITVSGGYRRIAPQLVYTNHEWDDVLDLYYAKARFYDPAEKRFLSMDPVKGTVIDPQSLVPYVYCVDNPLKYTDPLGMILLQVTSRVPLRSSNSDNSRIFAYLDEGAVVNSVGAWSPEIAEWTYVQAEIVAGNGVIFKQSGYIRNEYLALKQNSDNNAVALSPANDPKTVVPSTKTNSTDAHGDIEPVYEFSKDEWNCFGILSPLKYLQLLIEQQIHDNYIYNSNLPQITGYINGQDLGDVAKYRYGSYFMNYNGCEIIANYNALVALGNPQSLNDVANWGERNYSILRGTFGTFPISTRLLFEHLGYKVKAIFDPSQFDIEARKADACVFTYIWYNLNPIGGGAHTVYIKVNASNIEIYNAFNSEPNPVPERSFSAWLSRKNYIPLVLYCIYK